MSNRTTYYVIALNTIEFKNYLDREYTKSQIEGLGIFLDDYKFVSGVDTLRGIRNPRGVFTGNWRQRKDMEDIFQCLLSQTDLLTPAHSKISETYRVWREWYNSSEDTLADYLTQRLADYGIRTD